MYESMNALKRGVGVAMVLVAALPSILLAQTGTIEGRVVAADPGTPLADIEIRLEGTERGTLSAEDGTFTFTDVPAGRQTVVAGGLGFGEERRRIRVGVVQTVVLQIELSREAIEVGGITVVARRGGLVATDAVDVSKLDASPAEVPQAVSVITRAQLAIQNVTNLSEATRYSPGVQTEPWGVEPRLTFIRIRGFDATTTGLFQDGLQLRNPGFAVGYNLEPYGAERIEVLRGPASVLFGAGSPGGLVNYVSKRPTSVPLYEAELEVGSFDRYVARADLSGPLGSDFSYRLTGLFRESGTQIDFIRDDRRFLAPTLTWRPGERTTVTFLAQRGRDRHAGLVRSRRGHGCGPHPQRPHLRGVAGERAGRGTGSSSGLRRR